MDDSKAVYRYDLNGNLTTKTVGEQITYYHYDALNRLISIESPVISARYVYDSFGRRLSKTLSSGHIETYLYQGEREIGMMQDGRVKQLRVLGIGKGAELGAAVAIELKWHHICPIHDHRGCVCALINADTGQQAAGYRYTAFGEIIAHSGIESPWTFASKRYDAESGFIYFSKRYYSADLGRWITPDPIGFADGPNLYAYVHNNPLSLIDPWGLFSQSMFDRNSLFRNERMIRTLILDPDSARRAVVSGAKGVCACRDTFSHDRCSSWSLVCMCLYGPGAV